MALRATTECWGKLMMFCCFFIHALLCGLLNSSGVIYVYLQQQYPDALHISLAATFSIQVVFATLTGILSASIVQCIGVRWSVVLGGIITATGFMLWSACTKLYLVYITLAAIAGTGIGLCVTPSVYVLDWYFDTLDHRTTVNLAASGSSLGTALMPLIIRCTEEAYGISEIGLILGFVCLSVSGLGSTMRPIKEVTPPLDPKQTLQFSSLKRIPFTVFCASNFLWSSGIAVANTYLPVYAISIGHNLQESISFICFIGISAFCSRLFFALFDHTAKLDKESAVICTLGIAIILTGLFPQMFRLGTVKYGYAILLGVHIGHWTVYIYSTATDDIGTAAIIHGKGWINLSVGLGLATGPIISALILDFFDNFNIVFYTSGVCLCIGSILLMSLNLYDPIRYFVWKRITSKFSTSKQQKKRLLPSSSGNMISLVTTV